MMEQSRQTSGTRRARNSFSGFHRAALPSLLPSPFLLTLLLPVAFLVSACATPDFFLKEYALYNLQDEGFLTPDLIQTIGRSDYPVDGYGLEGARRICTDEALQTARKRSLKILLHTYYNLPAIPSGQGVSASNFERDYPFPLTERDYIRAEIDFQSVLKRGYIALQDMRSSRNCTVVFRIYEKDLIHDIRNSQLTFQPENFGRPEGLRPRLQRNDQSATPSLSSQSGVGGAASASGSLSP